MARRVRVGRLSDFADGELRAIDADGVSLVVGRERESLCAARNRCPHMGLPLSRGPGGVRFDEGVVTCPWHNSSFELCSGENLDWATGFAGRDMPRWTRKLVALGRTPTSLTTVPVVVEGEDVFVEL